MHRNHSWFHLPVALAGAAAVALFAAEAAADDSGGSGEIVNGTLTNDFPSTGSLLLGANPETAGQWCSGTMIGCKTFLTAAHCFDDHGSVPGSYLVFLQHAGFFTIKSITPNPGYSDVVFGKDDEAIVVLDNSIDGISPTPINTTARHPFMTLGTIVGFGKDADLNVDYGLKRFGSVRTETCEQAGNGCDDDDACICWVYDGTMADTCNADSGGPLFINGAVAGTTSGGNPSCTPDDPAFDADTFVDRVWITASGGADLNNTTCGKSCQIGEPGTLVYGFDGTVGDAPGNEGRHDFEVPKGTARLVVTMNAEEPHDFDLFVRRGAPPTTATFDCEADGPNQFGTCIFSWPGSGTWHILINQFSGEGTYQTTATVFQAKSIPTLSPMGTLLLVLMLLGGVTRTRLCRRSP